MSATLAKKVLEDDIAVSLAKALAEANQRARDMGIDVPASVISVTELFTDTDTYWRVNCGPKDYIGRRGGDLVIDVDQRSSQIAKVLRGQ